MSHLGFNEKNKTIQHQARKVLLLIKKCTQKAVNNAVFMVP